MPTMEEIAGLVREQGHAMQKFIDKHNAKIEELQGNQDRLEKVMNRPAGLPIGTNNEQRQIKSAYSSDGKRFKVYGKAERLADDFVQPSTEEEDFTLSNFVRSSMGISQPKAAVQTGTAIVPQYLSADIIDAVRAKSRVVQAGAVTIPIEGPTTLCRIDGDPTVYQHTQGATDISESDPTFTPVDLDPKALVALVPITMEAAEDAGNLEAALKTSLAGAFAKKLDSLALASILADTNIATSSTGEDCATWSGIMSAVSAMLGANMDLPTANICNTADFAARAASTAATSGVWLGPPPALVEMLDLFTTSMSEGTAILGDFTQGVAIAARTQLQLEVSRWHKATSGQHMLVAHARIQGYVLQPNSLYIQETTVA